MIKLWKLLSRSSCYLVKIPDIQTSLRYNYKTIIFISRQVKEKWRSTQVSLEYELHLHEKYNAAL